VARTAIEVPLEQPTLIKEDNQAIARNPVSHGRTKYIDIRYHFIREAIQERNISLEYCPTEDMLADLLTKPIPKARFKKLRDEMGMGYSAPQPTD
jgi:KUP system potassium uptake protein